jgi:hypothetical protein
MPTAKPYVLPKQLVWDAYQRVKANQGAAGTVCDGWYHDRRGAQAGAVDGHAVQGRADAAGVDSPGVYRHPLNVEGRCPALDTSRRAPVRAILARAIGTIRVEFKESLSARRSEGFDPRRAHTVDSLLIGYGVWSLSAHPVPSGSTLVSVCQPFVIR